MPSPTGPTSRDSRSAIIAGSALLTLLAWTWVVHVARGSGIAGDLTDMPGMMTVPMPAGSEAGSLGSLFVMWAAMMVGMMLPSALPSVLLYAAIAARRREAGGAPLSVPVFTGGYLLVWIGFSLVAALIQTRLRTALLPMASHSRAAGVAAGIILLATGAYEWTRLKWSCLSHCRSPLAHFTAHWREGGTGALRMGAEHGLICLGCCGLLMALLFVGGVMNPWWVGALTLLVLLEKVVPRGDVLGRAAGAALALWGVMLVVESVK